MVEEAIYLVGNSHIDLSWLWTRGETIHEICPRTFTSVLKLLKDYQPLKFSQSSAQIYLWMERYYPEIFEEIRRRVKEGRWEIVGGSWTEHNATIPCGESLVRQYLLGKRYFMDRFGVDVKVGWLPDTFGFCWSLPQILKKCGIDFFLTFKLKWQIERMDPPIPFPYYLFWWRSPDGSKVLAYHTVGKYNERLDAPFAEALLLAQLEELKRVHGIDQLMVLFGLGDHGGGPTRRMVEKALTLKGRKDYPRIVFSRAEEYFNQILKLSREKELPTVNDELYVKTHRGTLTTEAMMKTKNRRCEVLLLTMERFYSIARRFGVKYPKEELRSCWRRLLFNQVHDNLDGTSIEQVYQDAATDYREIELSASRMGHLRPIAERINTLKDGCIKALVIFNPLPWRRRSVVEIPKGDLGNGDLKIIDQNRAEVQLQTSNTDGKENLTFIAEMPPMGYKVYWVTESRRSERSKTDLKVEDYRLENSHLTVEIKPNLNHAIQIYDKENRRVVFNPNKGGNILEIYEDRPPNAPDGEPAWNIYLGSKCEPEASRVYVVERGPIRGRIRIERTFGNSTFIQDVILYKDARWVEFEVSIDWHEHYRFAKIAFPLNISASWATYEIPYGAIQRYDHSLRKAPQEVMELPERRWEFADAAKWEVSAQRWVDVSTPEGDYGVSLINENKYGFSFEKNTLRMSLLRGPRRGYRFTPESWADQSDKPRVGVHRIRYAIYPHKGDWKAAGTVRMGYEFNYPPQIVFENAHGGDLPPQHSFLEVSPENVILTALKEAEDSDDLILRVYESHGVQVEAEVKFDVEPVRVWQTDLMEWDKYIPKTEYKVVEGVVRFPLSPWEIKTLKVRYSH